MDSRLFATPRLAEAEIHPDLFPWQKPKIDPDPFP
jgi:hypothetical protein